MNGSSFTSLADVEVSTLGAFEAMSQNHLTTLIAICLLIKWSDGMKTFKADQKNIHLSEVSFAVFNIRKVTGFNKHLGVTALSIYCGCYGMMLVSLTTHFYYRFLSVTRPSKLSRFSMRNFPIWALLVLISYFIWFSLTYFVNGSSSIKDEVLIPEFKRDYCMQPDDFSYVGIQYYYTDPLTGETRMHIPSLFSITVFTCFMTLSSGSMTYFGVKTYAHLNELTMMTSVDFRELQNQLFRTLVIQTLIPSVFMYLPVGSTFLFPLFGLTSEAMRNFVPISVALCLCFEPLVAMYFIKIFRTRIIEVVTCQKYKKRGQVSSMQTTT
ncbi:hypothetical protein GCK72_019670 [Caenorhabditis remanei]|uniref:Seven TM Receptor n=1 Tax=Caenorhabditis remanei TaxID=31234 RepID=A0A6A5GEE6_CAERE|nr:hypothetical protein GCK72_019670 [Caenorhabditis remanei]KAF1753114.1 hypothetical protein GCK72_019670 [Caenorhabditis remanei]